MIKLTTHCMVRFLERKLQMAWIERVVSTPDWTAPDRDPALTQSFKAIAEAGSRVLKVVHRPDGEDVAVVTAHFDRDAKQ